jgi:hypothetical protein
MNQRATDTPEQVLKFAPKEKAPNRVAQLDDAGQAIVAQIRTAADLAKEDCDRAMSLAHKLSMELRAAEDRTQQMAREVEHWRDRAARAEQWLRTIQQEIEEKLLTRRSSPGAEGVAADDGGPTASRLIQYRGDSRATRRISLPSRGTACTSFETGRARIC